MMRYLQANVFCVYQGGEKIPRKYFEKKERKTEIDKLLKMRHVALAFCWKNKLFLYFILFNF